MFKFSNKNTEITTLDYQEIKRLEAICRGRLEDYSIEFPNGRILNCKFNR